MDDTQKERLVRQLRPIALRFAWHLHLRPTDQQDFLQECLWQALLKGDDFLQDLLSQPEAIERVYWFLRSVAGHFVRSRNTLGWHETCWSSLAPQDALDLETNGQAPASLEEDALLRIDLEDALCALPDDQRQLFLRRHVYGEDYATLARDFQTSEQAVRKRLSYIRKKLALELKS